MTAVDPQSVPPFPAHGGFILCPCHPGAEAALARRQAEVLPGFSRAAWRRGLVTFRAGPDAPVVPDDVATRLVFAHTVVVSLGQVSGAAIEELAGKIGELVGGARCDAVHVWKRDPRLDVPVADVRRAVAAACGAPVADDAPTRRGAQVLDCAIDAPDRWWVGWHRAATPSATWPGGIYPGFVPETAVSRAWLKLDEALATFGLTLERGERALELGAAPGGACQRLLEAGLDVSAWMPRSSTRRSPPIPGSSSGGCGPGRFLSAASADSTGCSPT
ncbi:MAG: SAM-dependent methyltransferase [Planctomycetaceae bacterium]